MYSSSTAIENVDLAYSNVKILHTHTKYSTTPRMCYMDYHVHSALRKVNANQKHPRCKKSKAKSKAPVSSYSYVRLKSVISGRGKGVWQAII